MAYAKRKAASETEHPPDRARKQRCVQSGCKRRTLAVARQPPRCSCQLGLAFRLEGGGGAAVAQLKRQRRTRHEAGQPVARCHAHRYIPRRVQPGQHIQQDLWVGSEDRKLWFGDSGVGL